MSDITMCFGTYCEQRDNCYRYVATPSGKQSYFAITPWTMYEGRQVCVEQWPMKEERDDKEE